MHYDQYKSRTLCCINPLLYNNIIASTWCDDVDYTENAILTHTTTTVFESLVHIGTCIRRSIIFHVLDIILQVLLAHLSMCAWGGYFEGKKTKTKGKQNIIEMQKEKCAGGCLT